MAASCEPDKDGAYRIPLEENGSPANSLKAILYAPGCQFTLVSVDLTSTPTRSATFECRQLSTITLRGRISPPLSGTGALDVEIRCLTPREHKFFGIFDGMIGQFSVEFRYPVGNRSGAPPNHNHESLASSLTNESAGSRDRRCVYFLPGMISNFGFGLSSKASLSTVVNRSCRSATQAA